MPAPLPDRWPALAVFCFEEEAEMFLRLSAGNRGRGTEAGWSIRKVDPGDLVSILLDQGGRIELVALDPLPVTGAEPANALASMGREDFLDFLLDNEADRHLHAPWAVN